ncbi:hypothetical protein ACHAWX_003020 [Stephanocyclus meneghinianus]
MSSVPPDPNELLRLLLAQQQELQQSAAPFAALTSSYQQQPMKMHLPALSLLTCDRTVPSLSQLIDHLQAVGSTRATNTPAPATSKPQENYQQLQRYLQASGVMQANNSSAVPAKVQQSSGLAQDGGTLRDPPLNVVASYPPQIKQKLQQPINEQARQQQNPESQQQQDNILSLLRLLAEINPGMAAAAVTQALNIISSPTVQVQQQNQQALHLQSEPQKQLRPQKSLGQNQHQHASTPSPLVLSPQQLTSPTQLECVTITGFDSSSAPLQRHNTCDFAIPSANGIIKSESDNNRCSRIEQIVSRPLASNAQETPSTEILSNIMFPPTARSKSLDHEFYGDIGKGASNGSKGKAKSRTNESTSKPCNQKSKKHPPSLHSLTKQSRGKQIAPPVATASEIKQEPLSMAAVTSLPPPIPTPDKATLQNWSLEQLEMHVQHLKHARQPIPQHLAILLFNTRRMEEKRKAKRLANRKSATLSRARRKSFIDDLTKDNTRLRKKAAILKFLPDPVIAITMEGVITFCGSQVEKVLNYNITHLMGVNIGDVVVPESRRTIQRMLQDRVCTTKRHAYASGKVILGGRTHVNELGDSYAVEGGRRSNPNNSSEALLISDQSSEKSVPILEFHANRLQPLANDFPAASAEFPIKNSNNGSCENKNTGNSAAAEISSSTHQKYCFGSETYSQSCPETSNYDDSGEPPANGDIFCKESSEAKFSCEANDRMTNLVDDVVGAHVTANNLVHAKVSSLMHHPKIDSQDGTKIPEKAQATDLHSDRKNSMEHPLASPGASYGRFSLSIAESCRNITKTRRRTSASDCSGHGESKETPEEANESPEGASSLFESSIGEKGEKLGECLVTSDIISMGMFLCKHRN